MKLLNFPELRQTYEYDCGAKALQAVLEYYGIDVSEGSIMRLSGTNPKHGTLISGIIRVLKKNHLKYKAEPMAIQDIVKYVDRGIPIIIILQAWTRKKKFDWKKNWTDGHYVVAIGYDKEKIYFEDPYAVSRTYLTFKELENRWHHKERAKKYLNYGIAVYGKRHVFDTKRIVHMD